MALRPGTDYLVADGKATYIGKMVRVVSVDPPSLSMCTVEYQRKTLRFKKDWLAATPDGEPILPAGNIPVDSIQEIAENIATPSRRVGRPKKETTETGKKLSQYQKAKKKREEAENREFEENPRRRAFVARKRQEGEVVYSVGDWPLTLPPFTVDQVVLEKQLPLPTMLESFYVALPTKDNRKLGVGIIWQSLSDRMWRALGGANSTYITKEAALQNLVFRRQPTA